MAIPCAVLMCHAPIVIPAVGGARSATCSATTQAMRAAAEQLCAHHADVLVIVSPHTPRHPTAWGVCSGARLTGDMGRFGKPELSLSLPGAPGAAQALRASAAQAGLLCHEVSGGALDHGAFVPLYFVHEAGWRGATLLLALPHPDTGSETRMGEAIAQAAAALGQRWLLLASGDMSHRLEPNAPAGFHPRAREFDARFRQALDAGDLRAACNVDEELRALAAEDVVDSCAVAAGAVAFDSRGSRVLAYEGPFGVGYLEAVLHEPEPARAPPPEGTALLGVARDAIAAALEGRARAAQPAAAHSGERRGVFVTLRTPDGELRGCIGHVQPVCPDLAEEVARCAVAAASQDPRFPPVTRSELDELTLELSLLTPLEPVANSTELDPRRYGIVVAHGAKRGVLLPDIPGVNSVEEQIAIARRKAGIATDEPVELQRFQVQKLMED